MSTDVTISKSGKRYTETATTIATARIRTFTYDSEQGVAMLVIAFIDNLSELYRETWIVKGAAFAQAMSRAPVGTNMLDSLKESLTFIVNNVENTPGRKDLLIAAGTLEVFNGEIRYEGTP